jgi:chromosome segregation ATPase
LDGNAIKITDTNFTELNSLCDEFGFTELATKLSEFHPSMDLKEAEAEAEAEDEEAEAEAEDEEAETEDADANARGRIAALKEKSNQHSHVIAILEDKVTQLVTDLRPFVGEISSLRSAASGIQTLSEEVSVLNTQIG